MITAVDEVYSQEVTYLNNSPHTHRLFKTDANGERVLLGEKKLPVVTGNMSDAEANKVLGHY